MSDYYALYGEGASATAKPGDSDKSSSDQPPIYPGGHEPFEVRRAEIAGEVRKAGDDQLGHFQAVYTRPAVPTGHTPIQWDIEIEEAPAKPGEFDIEIEERR